MAEQGKVEYFNAFC